MTVLAEHEPIERVKHVMGIGPGAVGGSRGGYAATEHLPDGDESGRGNDGRRRARMADEEGRAAEHSKYLKHPLKNDADRATPPPVPVIPTSFPELLDALRPSESRAVVATEPIAPFKIAHVNRAWEDLCGYKSSQVSGKTIGSILHGPDTDRGALSEFTSELTTKGGGGGFGGEARPRCCAVSIRTVNYRGDGSRFVNEVRAAPLLADPADGTTVRYYVAVLRDVSSSEEKERGASPKYEKSSSGAEGAAPAVVEPSTIESIRDDESSADCSPPSVGRGGDRGERRPSFRKRVSFEDMFEDEEEDVDSPAPGGDEEGGGAGIDMGLVLRDDVKRDSEDSVIADDGDNAPAENAADADAEAAESARPDGGGGGGNSNRRRSSLGRQEGGRRMSLQSLLSVDSVLSSSSLTSEHWCWGRRNSKKDGNGRDGGSGCLDGCRSSCWNAWKRHHFKPAVPTSEEEFALVREKRGEGSWHLKAIKLLNSDPVQKVLVSLLLCDVLILFVELYLDVAFPSCVTITRDAISCCPADCSASHRDDYGDGSSEYGVEYDSHGGTDDEHRRFLGGGGHGYCEYPLQDSHHYPAACDDHKYEAVHTAHSVLFGMTIFILSTFMLEILLLIACLGPRPFFSRFLYVLDFLVIGSSLALEITFATLDDAATADVAGLLVVFRLWRFVRIGHGLVASTNEMAEHKMNKLKEYTRKLEDEVIETGGVLPESRWSLGLLESATAAGGKKGKNGSSRSLLANGAASKRSFNVEVGGRVVSSKTLTSDVPPRKDCDDNDDDDKEGNITMI